MTYDKEQESFVLTSGRVIWGGREFEIGIHDEGRLSYGYDGYLDFGVDENLLQIPLTAMERVEIADYMIAAWQAWKDK